MTTHLRRASIVTEVALTLPLFLVMLAGAMEWGWAMPHEVDIEHIARDAARAGALTRVVDGPEAAARARTVEALVAEGIDPATVTLTTATGTTASGDVISVDLRVPYRALLGLVPAPADLHANATMRLENQ